MDYSFIKSYITEEHCHISGLLKDEQIINVFHFNGVGICLTKIPEQTDYILYRHIFFNPEAKQFEVRNVPLNNAFLKVFSAINEYVYHWLDENYNRIYHEEQVIFTTFPKIKSVK